MNKGNNLAQNTLMLSAGNVLSKGIHFILVIFVSHWLSAESYGTFDVVCTYVTLLLPVLSLSTGEAMFRFSVIAKTREEQSVYITNGFLLVACNLGVCIVVIGVLATIGVFPVFSLLAFLFLLMAQLPYNSIVFLLLTRFFSLFLKVSFQMDSLSHSPWP